MMSWTEHDTDWRQLEAFVEQLHASAHAPIDAQEFYRGLLEGCVTLLAAEGGAVWMPVGSGRWRGVCEVRCEIASDGAEHFEVLQAAAGSTEPLVLLPRSRGVSEVESEVESRVESRVEKLSDAVLALMAVREPGSAEPGANVLAVVELYLRPGSSPEVQQGWRELLATVAEVAAEFHLHEQLRTLRAERGFTGQSLGLMRRFQQSTDLQKTSLEIVNEGRRFVGGDRLSLLVRRGKTWQLLATSGVERVEARADVTKRLQMLAAATADWGEPLEYADESQDDYPPALAELVEQHVDESQTRRLVAVPVELNQKLDQKPDQNSAAVLVAEQFTGDIGEFSRLRVLELASLCEPALRQAVQLDRFPVRGCLRWADRWAEVTEKWGLTKLAVASVAAMAVLLVLIFVKVDFEIEAPATLRPAVERDIFATATGKVTDVRIAHGEQVEAGDVLAVLSDPQLAMELERTAGEIATTRKRLEAIAVARTDRQVREDASGETLPLSAEAEQLKKRLASLQCQQGILRQRREALTLRSPIAGTVLTLDVQNLLRTRPVERGQVLFTIAETSAGWRLLAQVPQDRIRHLVLAQQKDNDPLVTRFRLAGETEKTFVGHVESISTAAVLDTTGLNQKSPAFEVKIDVDESELPMARPGMNAEVRILCGRRSLGYVWLHDIWETIYSWVVF